MDKPVSRPNVGPPTLSPGGGQGAGPASVEPVKDKGTPPDSPPSPEEQMERFAEDLKERDWGHQPC